MDLRRLKRLAGLGLVLAAAATAGCARYHPNVLVIVMDACRPDKMGCYGFDRPTTPAIDALAADPDSVVFERHYVQANWTKPSTASLFTGLHVNQHRVTARELEQGSTWLPYLHPQLPTMAEHFRDAGYFTWATVKIPHLDAMFGFDRGFEHYARLPVGDVRLSRKALALATAPREAPFFGYIHFIACHYPYKVRYRNRAYVEEYAAPYPEEERALEAGVNFRQVGIKSRIMNEGAELEPRDVDFLNVIYESSFQRFDQRVIDPLILALRESGLYDDTMIVLTADHGEELYEHSGYGHGHDMWEEVIHVPLIVKFPAGRRPKRLGSRWKDLSRAIDLFPSLASAANLKAPENVSGQNLFDGSGVDVALTEAGSSWSIVSGDHKLIYRDSLLPRLYDLVADPGETVNLAPDNQPLGRRLREASVRRRAENPPPELAPYEWGEQSLPPEAIEELKSLGYVD